MTLDEVKRLGHLGHKQLQTLIGRKFLNIDVVHFHVDRVEYTIRTESSLRGNTYETVTVYNHCGKIGVGIPPWDQR